MIEWLLDRFFLGWSVVSSNFKLAFAIVMLIVIPLILTWAVSSIFNVASLNINSIEVDEVSNLHHAIQLVVDSKGNNINNKSFSEFVTNNSRLTNLRLVNLTDGEYEIRLSIPDENGKSDFISLYKDFLELSVGRGGESLIFPFVSNNIRKWQAIRYVNNDFGQYFIVTTHNYSQIDSLLASRTNNLIPFFLVIIFALGLMVFWVYRQSNLEPEMIKLRQQIKENDLFSGNMVHELRSPLTAIKGYASLIEESVDKDSDLANFSKQITDSSTRMINLVNDFLNATRIQSGQEEMIFSEIEMVTYVKDIVEELRPLTRDKSITLSVETDIENIRLRSSEKHLRQVLTNLISNSIKYTNKGSVKVSVEKKGKHCTVIIKDTGVGMSAEDQKKIFTPFVRVGEASTSHHSTGSGLGMWITKKILESLGGNVGVESIKDVGTHIVVKLPLKQ
jgi:signal transduction histidine kinase